MYDNRNLKSNLSLALNFALTRNIPIQEKGGFIESYHRLGGISHDTVYLTNLQEFEYMMIYLYADIY